MSGAYGTIDDTWELATSNTGIGGEYKRAMDAPQDVQDANALWLLRKYGPNASITWAASGRYGTGVGAGSAVVGNRAGEVKRLVVAPPNPNPLMGLRLMGAPARTGPPAPYNLYATPAPTVPTDVMGLPAPSYIADASTLPGPTSMPVEIPPALFRSASGS